MNIKLMSNFKKFWLYVLDKEKKVQLASVD